MKINIKNLAYNQFSIRKPQQFPKFLLKSSKTARNPKQKKEEKKKKKKHRKEESQEIYRFKTRGGGSDHRIRTSANGLKNRR